MIKRYIEEKLIVGNEVKKIVSKIISEDDDFYYCKLNNTIDLKYEKSNPGQKYKYIVEEVVPLLPSEFPECTISMFMSRLNFNNGSFKTYKLEKHHCNFLNCFKITFDGNVDDYVIVWPNTKIKNKNLITYIEFVTCSVIATNHVSHLFKVDSDRVPFSEK